ncbi:MAG TPA: RNA polymerase sigma factor [Terriglobales bacterium]|jgi:RNA polymerase sigma-70 factor (ECF subfamily)
MATAGILDKSNFDLLSDEQIVERVRRGETALYEIIMRRYNQRLYRVTRAILRDDGEAEDVMQDAYVRAYQHLHQFEGRAAFASWLTRIAVHEALARLKSRKRTDQLDEANEDGQFSMSLTQTAANPETNASAGEFARLLEAALLELPQPYRTVMMLRDVEELSTAETASILELSEENVKVRLHRARFMVRSWLIEKVGASVKNAFPFMGERCDRVVAGVFARISPPFA